MWIRRAPARAQAAASGPTAAPLTAKARSRALSQASTWVERRTVDHQLRAEGRERRGHRRGPLDVGLLLGEAERRPAAAPRRADRGAADDAGAAEDQSAHRAQRCAAESPPVRSRKVPTFLSVIEKR